MVSSICWTVIELLTVTAIPDLVLCFFRPFPQWICFLQLILKPALACRLLLLMDAIVIARYIIIFWLQNLLKFQDDFWCYFVNIWIVMFRFLKYFFVVPHLATFIFWFLNVIASIIAYIHPLYGAGVWTHYLLVMSCLP